MPRVSQIRLLLLISRGRGRDEGDGRKERKVKAHRVLGRENCVAPRVRRARHADRRIYREEIDSASKKGLATRNRCS